jgi:hypothetical protein
MALQKTAKFKTRKHKKGAVYAECVQAFLRDCATQKLDLSESRQFSPAVLIFEI